MPIVNSKPDAELLADLDATVAWAKARAATPAGSPSRPARHHGLLPRRAYRGSTRRTVRASRRASRFTARWSTRRNKGIWPNSPIELAAQVKEPVLGLYGEADTGIPVAQVEQMKVARVVAKKIAEFKIYPGAPHGFHADYRPSYREEADDGAQMTAWFKKYGVLS